MNPAQLSQARALVNSRGDVCVYFKGDFLKEPDLIVGVINDTGQFVPHDEVHRTLEAWLKDEERRFIEENEAEDFQLYGPAEREFAFAYGPTWRDLWAWDDDRDIWGRR